MEEGFDHQCLKAGNARGHERNEEIEWISGNVSLHLLCRNEESMSVYVEQDIARSKVNQSTTVFYLIFVNGKERYQLVSTYLIEYLKDYRIIVCFFTVLQEQDNNLETVFKINV